MADKPKLYKDGIFSTMSGVDSAQAPSLIQPDQLSYAVNITNRGGYPTTRPGIINHPFVFADTEQEWWFDNKGITGRGTYEDAIGKTWLAAAIGGRIFIVDTADYSVSEITPVTNTTLNNGGVMTVPAVGGLVTITVTDGSKAWEGYPAYVDGAKYAIVTVAGNVVQLKNITGTPTAVIADGSAISFCDPNTPLRNHTWFQQADVWFIIQNDKDAAILYNGSASKRSSGDTGSPKEVPSGGPMAYIHGRLWTVTEGHNVRAGDIIGGSTEVINWDEDGTILGHAVFRTDHAVTGMGTTATIDTSMGQGPLLVATREGIYSINVPVNRDTWVNLQYPLQTTAAPVGSCSHESMAQVNSDLFYRAPDGFRSLVLARREASEWGNVPISGELNRIVSADTPDLLEYCSGMVWQNWYLATVSPVRTERSVYHRGVIALDLTPVTKMGKKLAPAWDGFWSGPFITFLHPATVNGEKRGYAWCYNPDDCSNELWEFRVDKHWDNDPTDTDAKKDIAWFWESRALLFSAPLQAKKLESAELFVSDVRDDVEFTLYTRPDQSQCWNLWGERDICHTVSECDEDDACLVLANNQPGYRTSLGFGEPPITCDTADTKPVNIGYEHQIKLAGTGYVRTRKLVLTATIPPDQTYPPCT